MPLKEKLSSRKFWCAVINAVVNFAVILLTEHESVELVALAFSTIGFVVFIISEAVVDSVTIDSSVIHHVVHNTEPDDSVKDE